MSALTGSVRLAQSVSPLILMPQKYLQGQLSRCRIRPPLEGCSAFYTARIRVNRPGFPGGFNS